VRGRLLAVTALSMEDYLIQPVQRVPRYVLLLREVLRFTPEGHADREPVGANVEPHAHFRCGW
jgi:hypothetical protein